MTLGDTSRRAGSFGRFALRRELGRGGSAVVWEAFDPSAGRAVALKLLHAAGLAGEDQHERFRREAEALARLNHPHVVRVYESGSEQGTPYLVLELVGGGSMRELLRRGALSLEAGLELLDQVAQGLLAAHAVGIVHRDLKPGNVLLDELGRAKVADFGLARLEGSSIELTPTGEVLGTPRYMAPEQLLGRPVGHKTDVYALGAMLHELLVGAPPFADRLTPAELLTALRAPGPVPRPGTLRPGVHPALDALCAQALSKQPDERPDAAGFRLGLATARAALREEQAPRPTPRWVLPLAALVGLTLPLIALLLTRQRTALPGPAPLPTAPVPPPVTPGPEGTPEPGPPASGPAALPGWWSRLRPEERPPLPLPAGIAFGEERGEYVNARDGSRLVFVPGGRFTQGGSPGEGDPWELPPHEVELSPYFLGKYEVTVAEFRAFVAATGHVTVAEREGGGLVFRPSALRPPDSPLPGNVWPSPAARWSDGDGDGVPDADRQPVSQVSPSDADAYVRWAGLRLPSESEWERAAGWDPERQRLRRYPWGDQEPHAGSPRLANLLDERARAVWPELPCLEGYDDGQARAARVGSYPAGASPVGALDMGGNLAEVVADGADEGFYAVSPRRDPLRAPEGLPLRIVRGGSFYDRPIDCRSAARWNAEPLEYNEKLGFRVARGALER